MDRRCEEERLDEIARQGLDAHLEAEEEFCACERLEVPDRNIVTEAGEEE